MARLTRRAALAGAGAMLAAGAARAASGPRRLDRPGVQLWAVKDDLDRDFDGTLHALRRMGFERVEAAGWHGMTPQAFADRVTASGLTCDSAHYSVGDLRVDTDRKLAALREAGLTWVVTGSPDPGKPLDPGLPWMQAMIRAMDAEAWRRNYDYIRHIGERAAAVGLRYAHHNNVMEFIAVGGKLPAEEILRRTDPGLVHLELDVGWALAGGADPVAFMRRHAGRIDLLHLKDFKVRPRPEDPASWATVPLGRGVVDWRPILETARRTGISGWYIEAEPPFVPPALVGLKISLDYLKSL